MNHSTGSSVAKKATVIKMLILSAPWRVLLICVLILSNAILFAQLRQPLAIASPEAMTNKAIPSAALSLPTPPPTTPKLAANLATTPSIWPARGSFTSGFGWRTSPFGSDSELHSGIDIAYPAGAPVAATADGEVVVSSQAGGYGNLVQIDHGNGIATLYGHNSQLAVTVGQQVKKGQVIAYAGSTGRSTGSHVHYEVRVNDTPIDPMKYLVLY